MYVIIGSHFVPLEGIVRITLNSASNAPKCSLNDGVSIVQKLVCQTLKHFDNVISTCVKTDALSHLMLSLQ